MILESINSNADVHHLSRPDIDVLAAEIRGRSFAFAPSTAGV